METIINNLPEYKPNQVLTETSLNATSNFLEQQERLTRFGVTQTGIIENLEFKINQGKIIIEEGFGVSTDGNFMAHNYKKGKLIYQFAKVYQFANTEPEASAFLNDLKQDPFSEPIDAALPNFQNTIFYELFTKEQAEVQTDIIEIENIDANSFKIVLYLEIISKNKDQCSPTSCDSGGNMKEYRVVPMLVVDNLDEFFPVINCEKELKNQVRIKRFSNLYQIAEKFLKQKDKEKKENPFFYNVLINEYSRLNLQNTKMLSEKIGEILQWKTPISLGDKFQTKNLANLQIAKTQLDTMGMQYIPKVYTQDYPYNFGYVSQIKPISKIPKATNAFLSKTKDARRFLIKSSQSGVNSQAKYYYQYYLDFCNDLQMAINEYILQYNLYVQKHFSSYDKRVQRFLVLGRNDRYNEDSYRYYAIQNFANQDYRLDKETLFKYFNRIPILINKFKAGFLQIRHKTELRFIPSRSGNCKLEDKAIPFYYQQDLELENAWIVSKPQTLQGEIFQYRDLQNPYSHFVYNFNEYNFIRVEGDPTFEVTFDVAGNIIFEALDKNLKIFNVPMKYKVINIDNLANFDNLEDFLFYEHTGGTRIGGEYIMMMAKINGKEKIVADFQMMR